MDWVEMSVGREPREMKWEIKKRKKRKFDMKGSGWNRINGNERKMQLSGKETKQINNRKRIKRLGKRKQMNTDKGKEIGNKRSGKGSERKKLKIKTWKRQKPQIVQRCVTGIKKEIGYVEKREEKKQAS